MTATTYPNFGENTEGLEVAKAFAESIRGKTVLVTGVNRNGIGFTTAQAFVSIIFRYSTKAQANLGVIRRRNHLFI